MAPRTNPAAAARPIIRLAVADIEIPADRLRTLKEAEARAIGEAIIADGQYEPIAVCQLPGRPGYMLVDGLHRLVGSRLAGLPDIEARLVPADRTSRRRQEVLSAWARAEHDAFDMAAQVAAMVELVQAEVVAIVDDKTASATVALAVGWDVEAYGALAISRRSMFNYLKLHRFYDAAQKAILRDARMADELMPLYRLASLPPEDFDFAFTAIAAGEVKSIAEALAKVAPAPVVAWDKQKAKVLLQAKTLRPDQLSELIAELRMLYNAATSASGHEAR